MKEKSLGSMSFITLFALVVGLGAYGLSFADNMKEMKDKGGSDLDIVIKISQLDKALAIIDDFAAAEPGQPLGSPTLLLRGMLQGTDWIDPTRLIVIAGNFVYGQLEAAALIPFRHPNEGFQSTYQAIKGPDYYLCGLPPGQNDFARAARAAMVSAARATTTAMFSVELAAGRLLNAADEQIKKRINRLGELPRETLEGGPPPQDIEEMLSNLLKMADQLYKLQFGLDFIDKRLIFSFEATAADGTELADTFVRSVDKTSFLHAYRPERQINLRMNAYDVSKVMDLMGASFGKIYETMGIDFPEMAAMSRHFTGEAVYGISFDKEGMKMEAISVLKEPVPDILEKDLISCMVSSGRNVAGIIERETGQKTEPIYVRTPDSKVDGFRVMGIKSRFPVASMPNSMPESANMRAFMMTKMRMTTVGRLLLMASNDREIAKLINIAKKLKQGPAKGPMMTMDIDPAQYINSVVQVMPEFSGSRPLPQMDRAITIFDLNDGKATVTWSMAIRDLKALTSFFNQAAEACKSPSIVETATETMAPKPRCAEEEKQVDVEVAIPEKDADYWIEKGALCATYGNDRGAIRYFKKAIELDPDDGDAYFLQGVSYGEIGEYEKAVSSIDRALEFGFRKGLYLYGKGRVYLLSGEKEKAGEAFRHAAARGNRDASDYLCN
jgi:hypothetical protein